MLDINKLHSTKLATNISAAVMLPDNYNTVSDTYKPVFVLALSNIFLGTDYQKIVNEKKIALIAIYPSLNIKKNELLFESFESNYDFSYLYQDFIINEVIKALEVKYRISKNYLDRTIIGKDISSLMALTMPLDFTSTFGKQIIINLNLDKTFKKMLCYLESKFDPEIEMNLSMQNTNHLQVINKLLKDFGIKIFKEIKNNSLSYILQTLDN